MKRKKNRWRPLPLSSFQIIRKSRDDVNDAINERGCERAIVHQSANSRSVVIFSSSIAIWGVNLETILYLYALLFMRAFMKNSLHKKRSHFGNRRRHHFIVFYQRRRRQPVRRGQIKKKKTKERKKWRSTRRRGERATFSSRPLCSVSAEACITTRWRKGGKN